MIAVLTLVLVAGCLGGGPESARGGGATSATSPDEPATGDKAARDAAAGVSDAALARREVVHTADLVVRVPDVPRAIADAELIAERAGGYVAESESSFDASGEGSAQEGRLRLRVPPAAYEETLAALARLGTVESRSRSAEDKTSEVVDVESRIADQRASVTRIRQLMGRARTLADVVTLEAELSRREADLGALLARQAALRSQTQLATITLTLRQAGSPTDDQLGFLTGLRGGWAAFGTAVGWLLTAVGAALPFLAALALLAVPARLLLRRRPPSGPTPEETGGN